MQEDRRRKLLSQRLIPDNEIDRLAAVRSIGIRAVETMPELQDLAFLARDVFECAFAAVNIVDQDWLRLTAQSGIHVERCSREESICQYVVHEGNVIVVPDLTLEPDMATLPYVAGEPHLRSYAGAPIELEPGLTVGSFCVMHTHPRELADRERRQLSEFARIASALFRLQRSNLLMVKGEKALRLAAMTDPMTGFYNRHALPELVDSEMRETLAAGRPFGAAYLDMDGFKGINDRHGHQTGDEVLRQAAVRIRSVIRSGDIPLRMGGDEFVIFFPDCGCEDALTIIAARLVDAFRAPFPVDGIEVMAHLSVGAAAAPQGGTSREKLLETVDRALYEAKANGRDRYVVRADGAVS
ncbi:sensor domain-containing diguanylate cyclase [Rhizobium sp. NFR03]|uniref:GGDEF domain-containing protein n=1 Tax=Rhizobium sp. NFR03 TaxID=1566263 RepID=UPI0008D3F66B|nr:diguanylate cyclase (GGDEF) domain-containing protein [Rhizobium sp. NFR03]